MPAYRSRTTTHGRNMAGARALWRATGVENSDFGKPIIAIANSFTQFVPGHVHLKDLGQLVAEEIKKAGGIGREFNTIAVDDGIAMGHGGMLYSLPSRGSDCRCSGVYVQRALCRCTCLYLQLRQDHSGDVERSSASEYSDHFRVRWTDGGREGGDQWCDPQG